MMKFDRTESGDGKGISLREALSQLNEAAEESADKVRGLIQRDYKNLKNIFQDAGPEVRESLEDVKEAASESFFSTKEDVKKSVQKAVERIDHTARENAWYMLGTASLLSAGLGFWAGRKIHDRHYRD